MLSMTPTLALFSDVGGGEIFVIGIIALMLFGKSLPGVARNFGRTFAQFKKGLSDATSEIKTEIDAAAREVEAAKQDATAGVDLGADLKISLNDPPASTVAPKPPVNGSVAPPPSAGPGTHALPDLPAIAKSNVQNLDSSVASAPARTPLVVRPATGTIAARSPGAVSPAASLDAMNVPPPSKIPPPL
jgi:sec-independent protein translocase protein TatA